MQQHASAEVAMEREARRVFEQLHDDLAVADPQLWHAGSGGVEDPVGWTLLQPRHHQDLLQCIGDLCAVRYEVVDVAHGESGATVRCLKRSFRESAAVHRALEQGLDLLPRADASCAEVLAEGVVDFEVWPLLSDGPQQWGPWHPELAVMPDALEVRLLLVAPGACGRLRTPEDWDRAARSPSVIPQGELCDHRILIPLGHHER